VHRNSDEPPEAAGAITPSPPFIFLTLITQKYEVPPRALDAWWRHIRRKNRMQQILQVRNYSVALSVQGSFQGGSREGKVFNIVRAAAALFADPCGFFSTLRVPRQWRQSLLQSGIRSGHRGLHKAGPGKAG
jgi:hypothetical protein